MQLTLGVPVSFCVKPQKLAPLAWFSIACGHFPTVYSSLVECGALKLILYSYCAVFNVALASHVILSTYFNFYNTGFGTISVALLINHFCHVCTSFLAPWFTWLSRKEWQIIIAKLRENNVGENGKFVPISIFSAFLLNLVMVSWLSLLYFSFGSMKAENSTLWFGITSNLDTCFGILESFTDSLVPLQFFICCGLIQRQFQHTGNYLEGKIDQDLANLDHTLDSTRKSILKTSTIVEKVNIYFGMPLLFFICAKIGRSTTNIYGIIRIFYPTSSIADVWKTCIWNISYLTLDLSTLGAILWAAEYVSGSFSRFGRIVAEISTLSLNETKINHLNCFMGQLNYLQVELNAASFFALGKSLCPSVVSVTLTYIFVLMQFDLSDPKICPKAMNSTY